MENPNHCTIILPEVLVDTVAAEILLNGFRSVDDQAVLSASLPRLSSFASASPMPEEVPTITLCDPNSTGKEQTS